MDCLVAITGSLGGPDFFKKENLFCCEPLHKILRYSLMKYYGIPGENFHLCFSCPPEGSVKENGTGKKLPVLAILHDCFDIPKNVMDGIFDEYESSGDIKVYDRENKKLLATLGSTQNMADARSYAADYAPARSFRELREKNQAAQAALIEHHENNGVQFASLDGVGISPLAEIRGGAIIHQGTIIRGASKIGADTALGPNTLVDDSAIGENCAINSTQVYSSTIENNVKIGPFCHIRPGCAIKSGVKIGDFVEVKNSTVGENTHASHLTYIGDSDVGKDVNFGCGTITGNYDGIKKSRCEIRDGAFIGCNTSLVAPVVIGENAYTAAGSTITRDVPAGALAISRAKEQAIIENWVSRRKDKAGE